MENDISFDDFIKKHKPFHVEKNTLVIKHKYKDHRDINIVEFSSIELGNLNDHDISFSENSSKYNKSMKGKWILKYHEKTSYSKESIDAFYFIEELISKPIPLSYARMIQYSDCMVDTSALVFTKNAKRSGMRYKNETSPKMENFLNYVTKLIIELEYSSTDTNYF